MDFDLSKEDEILRDSIREFSEKEIKPFVKEYEEREEFPYEIVKKCAELGLMGMMIPESYGGAEMNTISYVVALEEISRIWASLGVIISVNNSLVCEPLYKYGNENQKRKFLIPLAKGERLGCFALTEPGAGSDAGNQKTTAKLDGDKWIINGRKNFITNAKEADICILFASTEREKRVHGISAFIIEKGTEGFSLGKIEKKLGLHSSSTCELILEDCIIPRENLLGDINKGFKIAMDTLDAGRIGIAAQALGIARASLEDSINYSRLREQFGIPISEFQAIRWMIADMAVEIDAARLLTYRAAFLKDKGVSYIKEASMAKLHASEVAMRGALKAIQIHGGYGYIKEYNVERYFRDAKITEIYEGTSEIQRLIISSYFLK